MDAADDLKKLGAIAVMLFLSFIFSVISVASDGWSTGIVLPLVSHYNAYHSDTNNLLWAVGCVVLVILGIICLSISAIILMSRYFGHGQGRAILGGVLSIFSGVVFVVTLIVFMVQQRPHLVYYGYSFALLWVAVPFAIGAGIVFITLQDSEFLK